MDYPRIRSSRISKFRLAGSVCAAAGLFFAVLLIPVQAQRPDTDSRASRGLERLDEAESLARMAAFRSQRLEGDFCFQFELVHKPRRARSLYFDGTMWGSWNEQGPVTRYELINDAGEADAQRIELIVQNGSGAGVWRRVDGKGRFQELIGEDMFDPVLPGTLFRPFDLLMPFVYWDRFEYEGPGLVGVGAYSAVQNYLMYPPEDFVADELGAVRLSISDDFNALFRIEILSPEMKVMTTFTVESVRKVQGQYIVGEMSLFDVSTRDRTTFKVERAATGLSLDRLYFDPLADAVPGASADVMSE
ncbi:hypothetical protein [Coraliomargarita parva]|uniref:hypothetical protein n=1 Tax=Coraliomargarita parva TaxID=3014050 RepID=UPI0022B40480|nr:hypothetical protein [Coraliomargarita parva]